MCPDIANNPADRLEISRRSFMRFATAASIVGSLPIFTEAHFARAQRVAAMRGDDSERMVHIDANENPLGPCKAARDAIASVIPMGGRYKMHMTSDLIATFATLEGLKPEYIIAYAGSSEPLHYTTLAYTSSTRGLVTGDPSYEAAGYAAKMNGARISMIPLTATHAHDVKGMVAADPGAGLIYICNPNNPTGTTTPRADIEWALANKPSGSILLIDEAYIHLSEQKSCIDLVSADKDVIVLRTFSKLYGMAGIRCGFATGRPDLLAKLQQFGDNALPITALAAAKASLMDKNVIAQRRKINSDIRNDTFEWLQKNNYAFIPSETNCFLLETHQPGRRVMAAMAKKDVSIGRVWPIMPTHVRITVGTRPEMEKFKVAFKQVMESKTGLEPAVYEGPKAISFPHYS